MSNGTRTGGRDQGTVIKINLAEVLAILDEADQVLDLGGIEEGRELLAKLGEMLRNKVEKPRSIPARVEPSKPMIIIDQSRSMTLDNYCEIHRVPMAESERKSLGGRLRRYCDRHGIDCGEKIWDGQFWTVRAWPVTLLAAWRNREINLDADPNWKPKPSGFRNANEVIAELRRQRNVPIPDGVPKPPWID